MASLSRILVPGGVFTALPGRGRSMPKPWPVTSTAEIILLHVVLPPLANYSSFEAMAYSSATDLAQEVATERAVDLAALPCKAPGGVRTHGRDRRPGRVICDVAATEKCDLIVMPTHGYGPFRRFLLGSVTAKVLHDAVCPVCTGPHMEEAPDYTSISFHQVVCAIDLGLHSREVLAWADAFAREYGAALTIVHAIPGCRHAAGRLLLRSGFRIELTRHASERIELMCEDLNVKAAVLIEAGETPVVVADAAESSERQRPDHRPRKHAARPRAPANQCLRDRARIALPGDHDLSG